MVKIPVSIVIDPSQKLSKIDGDFNLMKKKFITIKNENKDKNKDQLSIKPQEILDQLFNNSLQSVIIEEEPKHFKILLMLSFGMKQEFS